MDTCLKFSSEFSPCIPKSVALQEPLESQDSSIESQSEEKTKTGENSRDDEERDEMRLYERINDASFFINVDISMLLTHFASPIFVTDIDGAHDSLILFLRCRK